MDGKSDKINNTNNNSNEIRYSYPNVIYEENNMVIEKENINEKMDSSYDDDIIKELNDEKTRNIIKLLEILDLYDSNKSLVNDI